MPLKAPPRPHYTHKKPAKKFLKVYWPYLPLAISIGLSLLVSIYWQPFVGRRGVLAYATNMSVSGLLSATNGQRSANGRVALKINSKLNAAAQAKANDMVARNYWSHVTPDGKQPWYFFDQAGYQYQKAGENLAYGFDTSDAAVTGWMNSPAHRDNLLDDQFIDVGFGIANSSNYQSTGPETIVVAMYGKPATLGASTAPTTSPSTTKTRAKAKTPAPTTLKVEQPVSSPETLGGKVVELPPQNISIVQALTAGHAPWSNFAAGALLGGLVVYLLVKHGWALSRALRRSERYILHHPLLDLTLLSFIVLSVLLTHSLGVIR